MGATEHRRGRVGDLESRREREDKRVGAVKSVNGGALCIC